MKLERKGEKIILELEISEIKGIYWQPTDLLSYTEGATIVKTKTKTWRFPLKLFEEISEAMMDLNCKKIIIEYSKRGEYKVRRE